MESVILNIGIVQLKDSKEKIVAVLFLFSSSVFGMEGLR